MLIRTLADAERYLDGFINRERQASFDYEKLGLERVRSLLGALGNPQAGFPCVHVTGSKGKGSVALACEALLRAAGRRVGTYTSPHLATWRERFRIDGAPVGEAELIATLSELQPVLERQSADPVLCPSFFDVTTALAFELFRRAGADAGSIEVGLGGRLDSTNLVESRVSVLTTIELEHTDKLGDTTEAIAREKAGIMRKGVPFLHGPLDPGAWSAVLARSVAEDTPLEELRAHDVRESAHGVSFRLADGREVSSGVLGEHQALNLSLAVRACEVFLGRALDAPEFAALGPLRLPARLERIGNTLLDAAHTRESARVLRRVTGQLWPDRSCVLALSLSRDKDAEGVLAELAPAARACVITRAEAVRGRPPEELARLVREAGVAQVECRDDPLQAVARARELCRPDEPLVVAGSFYFAGAVRQALIDCAAP
jgi:dihydrofolate synthase/folylpolyglutamate synthase